MNVKNFRNMKKMGRQSWDEISLLDLFPSIYLFYIILFPVSFSRGWKIVNKDTKHNAFPNF